MRPPRLARSGADHRDGAPAEARSHRLVRRGVLLRVGFLQAAALAAEQPRQARAGWSPRWSTATWWRRCSAGSTIPRKRRARVCAMGHKWMWNAVAGRLAAGGLPDRGGSAAGRRRPASSRGATRPATRSPASSRRNGRPSSACARAFRFRSALSTRIGTPSARACAKATW